MADIRGTNPELWNGWKDALLQDLYFSTRRALRRGLENPIDKQGRLNEIWGDTEVLLADMAIDPERVRQLWEKLDGDYFLRHAPREIARHTRAILARPESRPVLVTVEPNEHRGCTEVFIYMPDGKPIFSIVTRCIERMNLTVTDARIITTQDGMALNTFSLLEEDGEPMSDPTRLRELGALLTEQLSGPAGETPLAPARTQRRLKHFDLAPRVRYLGDDEKRGRSVIEVVAVDRIGLLSRIADAMARCHIRLYNAKIATYGERAEDIFSLTDAEQRPLNATRREELKQAILENLGDTGTVPEATAPVRR
jgi:[protein-PII] uridylyltransferase